MRVNQDAVSPAFILARHLDRPPGSSGWWLSHTARCRHPLEQPPAVSRPRWQPAQPRPLAATLQTGCGAAQPAWRWWRPQAWRSWLYSCCVTGWVARVLYKERFCRDNESGGGPSGSGRGGECSERLGCIERVICSTTRHMRCLEGLQTRTRAALHFGTPHALRWRSPPLSISSQTEFEPHACGLAAAEEHSCLPCCLLRRAKRASLDCQTRYAERNPRSQHTFDLLWKQLLSREVRKRWTGVRKGCFGVSTASSNET